MTTPLRKKKYAETIGYETGRALKIISVPEIMALRSGVLTARGGVLNTLFKDAATAGAVVVLESAEALFESVRHAMPRLISCSPSKERCTLVYLVLLSLHICSLKSQGKWRFFVPWPTT